jgi:pimeloyl-ACP methyl ester carboxylesterase
MTSTSGPAVARRLPRAHVENHVDAGTAIVVLHGKEEAQIGDVVSFATGLAAFSQIVAPLGLSGSYVGAMDLNAYCWFHDVPDAVAPEPGSFGRSLIDVEAVVDEVCGGGSQIAMLGIGQGATLALSLLEVLPERLAWVAAVGGKRVELPPGALTVEPRRIDVPVLWLRSEVAQEDAASSVSTAWTVESFAGGLEDAQSRVRRWVSERAGAR